MSTHEYNRVFVDGHWDIRVPDLTQKIKSALPGKLFRLKADADSLEAIFTDELSDPEITELDATVAAHKVVAAPSTAKQRRARSIDARTRELISEGFEYPAGSGVMFSLSESAQRRNASWDAQREELSLPYPVVCNSLDDSFEARFLTPDQLHSFVLAGVLAMHSRLDSGTALKNQVRDAATMAEVQAVVDDR